MRINLMILFFIVGKKNNMYWLIAIFRGKKKKEKNEPGSSIHLDRNNVHRHAASVLWLYLVCFQHWLKSKRLQKMTKTSKRTIRCMWWKASKNEYNLQCWVHRKTMVVSLLFDCLFGGKHSNVNTNLQEMLLRCVKLVTPESRYTRLDSSSTNSNKNKPNHRTCPIRWVPGNLWYCCNCHYCIASTIYNTQI